MLQATRIAGSSFSLRLQSVRNLSHLSMAGMTLARCGVTWEKASVECLKCCSARQGSSVPEGG